MAAKKAPPSAENTKMDINVLFERELQMRNEDLRRQAAERLVGKLQPTNKFTVEHFIASLKQHRDVWAVVSTMGVVDFAEALLGGKARPAPGSAGTAARRTRLNETQKTIIKAAIQKALADGREGFNRNELATLIGDQLATIGVEREELANKLRQPLGELVGEGTIHTVGEKRLMKYVIGSSPRKPS